MDENNTKEIKKTVPETNTIKPVKKDSKDGKKKDFAGFIDKAKSFFSDIRGEFKKIIWPSRQQLIKETVIVICTSLIIGVVICGFDGIFTLGYNALVNLMPW